MQRMVQPRANEPVAHAVPELAASHRGGYAAREAACGNHARHLPRLRQFGSHYPSRSTHKRGHCTRGEAAPESAFLAELARRAGQGAVGIVGNRDA